MKKKKTKKMEKKHEFANDEAKKNCDWREVGISMWLHYQGEAVKSVREEGRSEYLKKKQRKSSW